MPQRVEFAVFPNTAERATLSTVNKVLGHVHRNPQMGFKQFREWLREQNLWDKETSPLVLELIGIQTQPKYQWTPFATQLYSAPDETQQQQILFRHLRDENVLLAKYVLTSIDVDSGGRLHSSHELYRVLTSYVYPGAYITLPSFQAWIRWMQACDAIRYIGIRWGLGEVGKAAIPWLRSRDDDEILEDMADDNDGPGPEAAPSESAVLAIPTPTMTTVVSPNVATRPHPVDPGGEDDLPDMPDEAEPPVADVAFPYMADGTSPDVPQRVAVPRESGATQRAIPVVPPEEPPKSKPVTNPIRPAVVPDVPRPAVGPVSHPPVRLLPAPLDAASVANTAEWIRAFWAAWPNKHRFDVGHFGLHPVHYDADRGLFLSKLAYLGVLATETTQPAVVHGFWEKLYEIRFLERTWAQPELFSDLLTELGFFANNPVYAKLSETLVYSLAFHVRIRNNPQWISLLEHVSDGRTLVESLHSVVYGGVFYLAPFWVVGQLVQLGLIDRPEIRLTAVVPTYRLRENAYRLGFIDSLYAESLPAWFSVSEAVSRYFGPDEGFGQALEAVSDHLGCAFNCGKVYVCPLACREKIGR